jgi:hypothetical protein
MMAKVTLIYKELVLKILAAIVLGNRLLFYYPKITFKAVHKQVYSYFMACCLIVPPKSEFFLIYFIL